MVFVDDVKTSFFSQNTNFNLIIEFVFVLTGSGTRSGAIFEKSLELILNEIFNICAVCWKVWLVYMVHSKKKRETIET